MSTRTPTPWIIKPPKEYRGGEIAGSRGRLFHPHDLRHPEGGGVNIGHILRDEDARRITDCVNALAGIEGEALDLLPRVIVDMRRAAAGAPNFERPSLIEQGQVYEAFLPLLKALGGPIDE